MTEQTQGPGGSGEPPRDGLESPLELFKRWRNRVNEFRQITDAWGLENQRLADLKAWEADKPRRYRWRRTLLAGLGVFISFFLGSLIFNLVEPFGINNATKAHSSRISARLMAPFYESRAQDLIAVVLIDQNTLDARGQAWPPRYEYYENVIRRVIRQEPRSVYFDILTSDLRAYDDSLADAKAALRDELGEAKVPLYFGVISPYARSIFNDVPGTGTAVAGWHGLGTDYPLAIYPENFTLDNQPLEGTPKGIYRAESVAHTLYRQACLGPDPICNPDVAPLREEQAEHPMALFWGWQRPTVPPEIAPLLGGCVLAEGQGIGIGRRLVASLSAGWNDFWSGSDPIILDAHREVCPPVLTILEHQLDDPDIASLLSGRVVLIGTRLAALDDSVVSPVHQRIPGVYMHAMALDNLMTWGEDRLYRDLGMLKVLGWGSALILSIAVAWIFRNLAGGRRLVALLLVGGLASIGGTVLLQVFLRQPPLDWIGALALFLLVLVDMRPKSSGKD